MARNPRRITFETAGDMARQLNAWSATSLNTPEELTTGPPTVGAIVLATAGWFRAIVLAADVAAFIYIVKVRPLVRLAQGVHRESDDGPAR